MNTIEVQNLQAHVDFFSFHHVSFTIEQGTVCGLVGKNGAGKTLLIHSLLGQVKRQSGSVFINGVEMDESFELAKQGIGVVWADCPFPTNQSITSIISFFQAIYSTWDEQRCHALLKLFDINLEQKVKSLSSGEQMKLQIALTLSHHPTLLILDEPTAHLDPFARDLIMEVLAQYMDNEQNTMLISSHILSDLEKLADTILFIEDGEIIFHENKDELTLNFLVWQPQYESQIQDVALAVVSERRGHYLLHKQHLTPAFLENQNHALHSPSMEEVLLFMNYTNAEVL